jgi:hypothetical protein
MPGTAGSISTPRFVLVDPRERGLGFGSKRCACLAAGLQVLSQRLLDTSRRGTTGHAASSYESWAREDGTSRPWHGGGSFAAVEWTEMACNAKTMQSRCVRRNIWSKTRRMVRGEGLCRHAQQSRCLLVFLRYGSNGLACHQLQVGGRAMAAKETEGSRKSPRRDTPNRTRGVRKVRGE